MAHDSNRGNVIIVRLNVNGLTFFPAVYAGMFLPSTIYDVCLIIRVSRADCERVVPALDRIAGRRRFCLVVRTFLGASSKL